MANWSLPTVSSPYQDIATLPRDLAIDAGTLFLNEPSNPIDGMIKLVRSPVKKFQERGGGMWNDVVLGIEGGGTGAATPADARVNLQLGTIATQNANNVNISGSVSGTISGNGVGLTSLDASSLSTGTIPDARFPSTLPALNGSNLTSLNGSNIASGTVPPARLGSGSSISTKFLRGDSTWQDISVITSVHQISVGVSSGSNAQAEVTFNTGVTLSDYTRAWFVIGFAIDELGSAWRIVNNTQMAVTVAVNTPQDSWGITFRGWLIQA